MGVHGLWELLAPVGRRVSVETLAGRRLAIDASIWMVQFMKAMRDEKGEMVRNAHLLGFFRRICKLLYLRTKPVFVFDGGTPALKRRTVIARRRQRENSQAKLRKTAEKLLLNHLKSMRLKELAEDIKNQRETQESDTKGKGVSDEAGVLGSSILEGNDPALKRCDQEKLDEMLAASILAEEEGGLTNCLSSTSAAVPCEEDGDEDEELILPEMHGDVDPAVLAALPPSMQIGLRLQTNKQANDAKGKRIMSDPTEVVGINSGKPDAVLSNVDQEKLDEMIAASIAAEVDASVTNNASISTTSILVDEDVIEEEDDEDEEMILPAMHGDVDPAVLAALPPSMQLDLLVQIRERLMAENRQKYQKVKKDPGKFSELQIQSYLKTVAFRREIDHVQKAASGRGFSGVQTSRIASESHREFIFSSSFTGDKQVLTAARAERSGYKEQALKEHFSNVKNSTPSTDNATASNPEESQRVFDGNIETYLDERGNVRVSRVRAMGIRMTRDLQRNLDLMKEMEQEETNANKITNGGNMLTKNNTSSILRMTHSNETDRETSRYDNGNSDNIGGPKNHPGQNKVAESLLGDKILVERNDQHVSKFGTPIEISIEDDGDAKHFDSEDDLFARLVAGNPVTISTADDTLEKQISGSDLDSDWEEGTVKSSSFPVNTELNSDPPYLKANNSDDSEVEWEEGFSGLAENTSSYLGKETTSKGYKEEEADLQEAIRRSLEDIGDEKCGASLEDEKLKSYLQEAHKATGNIDRETKMVDPQFSSQQTESVVEDIGDENCGASLEDEKLKSHLQEAHKATGNIDREIKMVDPQFSSQQNESVVDGIAKPNSVRYLGSSSEQVMRDASLRDNLEGEMHSAISVTPSGTTEVHAMREQVLGTLNESGGLSSVPNVCGNTNADTINDVTDGVDAQKDDAETESSCHLVVMAIPSSIRETSANKMTEKFDSYKKQIRETSHDNISQEIGHNLDKSPVKEIDNADIEVTEANLEEEMLILDQECMNLGDERRRLERNVESVSSEMFTECQELLQMFGIPYIIAPMEAEAQCAYLELANLVDGVVTDDSDVFLFGARSVYKNIFDDRKYVETYFMKTQLRLEAFYTFNERFAKIRSKRIKKAVKGITGDQPSELMNVAAEEGSNTRKKQSISTDEVGINNSDNYVVRTEKSTVRSQSNSKGKSNRKQSGKRKTSEDGQTNRKSDANGRGSRRGRGTSRVPRRGNRKVGTSSPESQSTSNDCEEADELENHKATFKSSEEMRRSGRLRKPVNYRVNDMDIDDLDLTDSSASHMEAGKQVLSKADGRCDEVVSGVNESIQNSAGKSSPKENQSKDYLEVGGGFCLSEDETYEPGLSNVDRYFQADVSENNTEMVGQIGEDENEIGTNRDGIHDRATAATLLRNGDLSDNSGFLNEADISHVPVQYNLPTKRPLVGLPGSRTSACDSEQSVNHYIGSDHSTSVASLQEDTVDYSGQPPIRALSAMPFLKKKRKR
ncbi:DNA repair protein UVH3 isoform X2 [Argentina anserina]|uniref:DNA repair protein UVH3 isoform X2 n=1 Tax=Argentina anserina TaxID=57926 RepID=UPI0021763922|nr:DNA repair protein UVH3 isoform X2 [Potentilla anserina]